MCSCWRTSGAGRLVREGGGAGAASHLPHAWARAAAATGSALAVPCRNLFLGFPNAAAGQVGERRDTAGWSRACCGLQCKGKGQSTGHASFWAAATPSNPPTPPPLLAGDTYRGRWHESDVAVKCINPLMVSRGSWGAVEGSLAALCTMAVQAGGLAVAGHPVRMCSAAGCCVARQ